MSVLKMSVVLEIPIHIRKDSLVVKILKSREKKNKHQKKQSFLAEQNPMI